MIVPAKYISLKRTATVAVVGLDDLRPEKITVKINVRVILHLVVTTRTTDTAVLGCWLVVKRHLR